MLYTSSITTLLTLARIALSTSTPITPQSPLVLSHLPSNNISLSLFAELEELSRVVDISYCVGTTGISSPFSCASRCTDFPLFELVSTFNTGPLMSDSCGYIALDHGTKYEGRGRVIVAFRGTYSIANTIVDLSTVPQEYIPYPDAPGNETTPSGPNHEGRSRFWDWIPRPRWGGKNAREEDLAVKSEEDRTTCMNCTVHSGFWTSWQNTRPFILPHIKNMVEKHPSYQLHLVGHSLGGAVAALAGLEFEGLGLHPTVTTFGEPRVGNSGLRNWIDQTFNLPSEHGTNRREELKEGRYRRLTHVDDPVPLLPLQEWGYRAHAGEIYISKPSLQPSVGDIHLCYGDEDADCISSAEVNKAWFKLDEAQEDDTESSTSVTETRWSGLPLPGRYKMWQLFFAHRDYFWRLGLCLPGGDPLDWGRGKYDFESEEKKEEL